MTGCFIEPEGLLKKQKRCQTSKFFTKTPISSKISSIIDHKNFWASDLNWALKQTLTLTWTWVLTKSFSCKTEWYCYFIVISYTCFQFLLFLFLKFLFSMRSFKYYMVLAYYVRSLNDSNWRNCLRDSYFVNVLVWF